jgi:hypothetical protein
MTSPNEITNQFYNSEFYYKVNQSVINQILNIRHTNILANTVKALPVFVKGQSGVKLIQ